MWRFSLALACGLGALATAEAGVPARVVKCSLEALSEPGKPDWGVLSAHFVNIADPQGLVNAELEPPFLADSAPKLYGGFGPPWDRGYFCTIFSARFAETGEVRVGAVVKRLREIADRPCSKFTGESIVEETELDSTLPLQIHFDYRHYGDRRAPFRRELFYFSGLGEFGLGTEAEAESACDRLAIEMPRHESAAQFQHARQLPAKP